MQPFIRPSKIKALPLLALGNLLLLGVAWIEAVYAFIRMPLKIPLWLNLFGSPVMLMDKSPMFFLYPVLQTLYVAVFLALAKWCPLEKLIHGAQEKRFPDPVKPALRAIKDEFTLLALIFFSMIFIHIQTSLIYLAYEVEKGFSKSYFFGLIILLILLIPYYRMRARMILRS